MENFEEVYIKLLADSERRIDKTNDMISRFETIMENITSQYIAHINQLTKCREDLLSIVTKQEQLINEERKRYDELIKHVLKMLSVGSQ